MRSFPNWFPALLLSFGHRRYDGLNGGRVLSVFEEQSRITRGSWQPPNVHAACALSGLIVSVTLQPAGRHCTVFEVSVAFPPWQVLMQSLNDEMSFTAAWASLHASAIAPRVSVRLKKTVKPAHAISRSPILHRIPARRGLIYRQAPLAATNMTKAAGGCLSFGNPRTAARYVSKLSVWQEAIFRTSL